MKYFVKLRVRNELGPTAIGPLETREEAVAIATKLAAAGAIEIWEGKLIGVVAPPEQPKPSFVPAD